MKLKEFNTETTVCRTGRAYVSINTKSGVFNFNKSSCDMIGLKAGDAIILHQDEEDPGSWFVEKATEGNAERGFHLRGKDLKNGLSFNNATLSRAIADSVIFSGVSGRILIAGIPTVHGKRTLYGLLTSTLKISE